MKLRRWQNRRAEIERIAAPSAKLKITSQQPEETAPTIARLHVMSQPGLVSAGGDVLRR